MSANNFIFDDLLPQREYPLELYIQSPGEFSRQKVLDVAQSFASIFTAVVASSTQHKIQTLPEAQQNQGIESSF